MNCSLTALQTRLSGLHGDYIRLPQTLYLPRCKYQRQRKFFLRPATAISFQIPPDLSQMMFQASIIQTSASDIGSLNSTWIGNIFIHDVAPPLNTPLPPSTPPTSPPQFFLEYALNVFYLLTILLSSIWEYATRKKSDSTSSFITFRYIFNPLKPELNPICYLLALLGAHNFLHVSRIKVKLLTFRLLMSYIYGAPILDVSRSHTTTQHSR